MLSRYFVEVHVHVGLYMYVIVKLFPVVHGVEPIEPYYNYKDPFTHYDLLILPS